MFTFREIFTLKFWKDTYGSFAMAAFLICVFSGVFVAIPYDPAKPYESISRMLLLNPGGSLFRNLHYWSAQLFLIFTVLHIWDSLKQQNEIKVKPAIWFRLSLSVIITFFVMLSGFIVKGDADSRQAWQILDTLAKSIPLLGDLIAYSLLGKEGNFQLLYVHHIATATIILFVLIIEHAKTLWGKAKTVVISFAVIVVLSIFFTAPLHDSLNPVMKGPWYFTGLQEILHNLNHPAWSLLIILVFLLILYFIPRLSGKKNRFLKKIILYSFYVYTVFTLVGFYFRGENWRWIFPWQNNYSQEVFLLKPNKINFRMDDSLTAPEALVVLGRNEGCLLCHADMNGFTVSHNPASLGCASCHGGNIFATSKKQAHKAMAAIPGQMNNAIQTCGTAACHSDIAQRMPRNLMATMSGVVSVDKWVFQEYNHMDSLSHIGKIGYSPADLHLRSHCASCHLGNEKKEFGPVTQKSRGGGCIACHIIYLDSSLHQLNIYRNNPEQLPVLHPLLSIKVTDDHCFGCHSRSGRISLSYAGWHETGYLKTAVNTYPDSFKVLDDKRVLSFIGEDVHHKAGLQCIDCHTSYEIMGDGNLHAHKEQQLQIDCSDCHVSGKPVTVNMQQLDREEALVNGLHNYRIKNQQFLTIEKSGKALTNSSVENDSLFLYQKNSGKKHFMKPASESCTNDKAHKRLACQSCHTQWAPKCIGCHNDFDNNKKFRDLLTDKVEQGKWLEHPGEFLTGPPTLGIWEENGQSKIVPVMPGMVLTVDKIRDHNTKPEIIFYRLFAPAGPHTTIKPEKNCIKCHTDPETLGYGKGKLSYEIKGKSATWRFTPQFKLNPNDSLPEDAWTGFLQKPQPPYATRTQLKPFTVNEQMQLLRVAACLQCHEENSGVMKQSLYQFKTVLNNRTAQCIIPVF